MTPKSTVTSLRTPGGVRHVIHLAIPLVLASSGHAVRLFADRVMLAHYSRSAIAASMPAGLTCFMFMSFFMGVAGYVNAFAAQYHGAGRHERIGVAVWQGMLFAALGGVTIAAIGQCAEGLFRLMGHAPDVQAEQVRYFRILCRFSAAPLMLSTLCAFWSGQGKTRVVMVLELLCAALNVGLNYLLIYGKAGWPEMGILGAGMATGVSSSICLLIAAGLFLSRRNRKAFGTWPRHFLNVPLMARLVRFGLPNGLQFMLEMAAFNLFVVLIGRLGMAPLEAANIAFSMNALAFLPILGLGMTASILVGQGIGGHDLEMSTRAVHNALLLALGYTATMGAIFTLWPGAILSLYTRAGDTDQVEALRLAARFLRYITLYLLFDAIYLVHAHAIKGAGDTRFAMWAGLSLSWGTLVLPCALAVKLGGSIDLLWWILVGHVVLAAGIFYLRYRRGHWQSMRVIEETVIPDPPESIPL